jgi:hypothetical protein
MSSVYSDVTDLQALPQGVAFYMDNKLDSLEEKYGRASFGQFLNNDKLVKETERATLSRHCVTYFLTI